MTKVLVTGDRHWKDREYIFERLDELVPLYGISEIIEGCARGADRIAEEWSAARNVHLSHFPADWAQFPKAAGAIRNRQMLKEGKPDLVVAFHTNLQASKGTKDMVSLARKAGVTTFVFPHSHEGYSAKKGIDSGPNPQ